MWYVLLRCGIKKVPTRIVLIQNPELSRKVFWKQNAELTQVFLHQPT